MGVKMTIHQRIKERIAWFKEVYDDILKEVKDPEIAKIIYRRILFEEG